MGKINRSTSLQLNAVIHLRADRARQEARELKDEGQPFLGVPILIKGLGQQMANVSDDQLYGPVRNPWSTSYTPGGSSGGSAAAVADGWVPLAAANDGGGSIRIPAGWTGLIGMKPTRGRVPTGPAEWRSWQGASINFALTRTVKDTALLLDQLQIVQEKAVFQTPRYQPGFTKHLDDVIPPITISYTTKSPVGTPVSDEAKQAVLDAVVFFR